MKTSRLYGMMFVLIIELAAYLLLSSWAAKWVAQTWKWDESLVFVAFFILSFVGWFFHVTHALNKTSDSP